MSLENLQDRFRGALLGAALGDALGAPFEGAASLVQVNLEDLNSLAQSSRYTDDTHMMIGIAQSLVECGRFDGEHMLSTFARLYAQQPWRGYGPGPPQVFDMVDRGIPWNEAASKLFGGEGSFGNGAAMRVAPVALFTRHELQQVTHLASNTSRLTHTHALAIDGAVTEAVAIAVVLSLEDSASLSATRVTTSVADYLSTPQFKQTLKQIESLLPEPEPLQVVQSLGNNITALGSVPTALLAFLRSPDSFEEVVQFAISLGGDTDTIACMAGALAGARVGESGLPTSWVTALEDGDRLRQLADRLYEHGRP